MRSAVVTLLSRPGCHLCDEARQVIVAVVADFPGTTVIERSIVDDPQLLELHAEEIPVVLIDGVVHNIWRVDPLRFRAALVTATA